MLWSPSWCGGTLQEKAGDVNRPLQARIVLADRRRRLWSGLHGRAAAARSPQGGGQSPQARHGQPPGDPARFEAERQALALMDHPNIARGSWMRGRRRRGALISPWNWCAACPSRTIATKMGLPTGSGWSCSCRSAASRAARPPKGHHSPRYQAIQRVGCSARWRASGQGDRLRDRQGSGADVDGQNTVHRLRSDDRYAALRESGTGPHERSGRGHADRRLLAGRAHVRALDGDDPV